jgi:hypothetical protein
MREGVANLAQQVDKEDKFIFQLVKYLTGHSQEHLEFKSICKEVFPSVSAFPAGDAIHRVQSAELLMYKMVGLKRSRRWIVSNLCSHKNFIVD